MPTATFIVHSQQALYLRIAYLTMFNDKIVSVITYLFR